MKQLIKDRGADSTPVAKNEATSARLGKSFETALASQDGEVEILPGLTLPLVQAAKFLQIVKDDDENISDALALNVEIYARMALIQWIESKGAPDVTPRFSMAI